MPIYEYQCGKCGKLMEVLQKISDPGPSKCDECGSKKVGRVMSQTSFQLKGEGWYITDYARKGKKDGDGASNSESASKSDSSSKGESSSKAESSSKTESTASASKDSSKKKEKSS